MCEMVIVQDEPEIFQFKQRKRIGGMYTLDEGSVTSFIFSFYMWVDYLMIINVGRE